VRSTSARANSPGNWERAGTRGASRRVPLDWPAMHLLPVSIRRRTDDGTGGNGPEIESYGGSLELKIYQGRRRIHREVFTGSGAFSLRAPLEPDAGPRAAVRAFQIRLSRAFSPPRLGLNSDVRRLGIVVRSARLE